MINISIHSHTYTNHIYDILHIGTYYTYIYVYKHIVVKEDPVQSFAHNGPNQCQTQSLSRTVHTYTNHMYNILRIGSYYTYIIPCLSQLQFVLKKINYLIYFYYYCIYIIIIASTITNKTIMNNEMNTYYNNDTTVCCLLK